MEDPNLSKEPAVVDDPNLSAFEVEYRIDGQLYTKLVYGHNDRPTPSDDDALHYTIWRYMPNGEPVTAFRCRYQDWVATSAPRDLPPTNEEIEQRDALRERADMAEMRAAEAEDRVAALVNQVEELKKAQSRPAASPSPPEPDDVPF